VVAQRHPAALDAGQHGGEIDGADARDVVAEDQHMIAVPVEDAPGIGRPEVLPTQQGMGNNLVAAVMYASMKNRATHPDQARCSAARGFGHASGMIKRSEPV
jgi:hypothetical protein